MFAGRAWANDGSKHKTKIKIWPSLEFVSSSFWFRSWRKSRCSWFWNILADQRALTEGFQGGVKRMLHFFFPPHPSISALICNQDETELCFSFARDKETGLWRAYHWLRKGTYQNLPLFCLGSKSSALTPLHGGAHTGCNSWKVMCFFKHLLAQPSTVETSSQGKHSPSMNLCIRGDLWWYMDQQMLLKPTPGTTFLHKYCSWK